MSSRYKLVVTSVGLSGITAHHSVTCHVEETCDDGSVVHGVPETYGIDGEALARKHNNDTAVWRAWVAKEMLVKHKRRATAHTEIMGWHNQSFDIEV